MPGLILALLISASLPALGHAQTDIDTRLADAAAGFVADEAGKASAIDQAAMVDCLLAQFEGLDAAEKEILLDQEDFEDTLDALVMAHPETEDALEDCLG